MAIQGIEQPEQILIHEQLRLHKNTGEYEFAFSWYQDEETVYLVDGVRKPYDHATLDAMYSYLDAHGELYFIEWKENGVWVPIGDVTFWQEDLPIVIGAKEYRGRGIGKDVVSALKERAKALGFDSMNVREIYDYNEGSKRLFESMGFVVSGKTEKGHAYRLNLREKP